MIFEGTMKRRYEKNYRNMSPTEHRLLELLYAGTGNQKKRELGEQLAAREACKQVVAILEEIQPDPFCFGRPGRGRLAYLNKLAEITCSLSAGRWTGACNALIGLVHFECMSRPSVRRNTIDLLKNYLEDDLTDVKKTQTGRGESQAKQI